MTDVLARAGYPGIALPPAGSVHTGILHGRVPAEGYQRGAGLEFGPLKDAVGNHPLFQEAYAAASGRSVLSFDRLKNLFLILCTKFSSMESQNIIEFGCYKGGSLLFFGVILKKLFPQAIVYGLDTYEGMPDVDKTIDLHSAGDFSDTSMAEIKARAEELELSNIVLIKGMVEDTFPSSLDSATRFGLAHIDMDIYIPIKHAQKHVWPMMARGGYVVYDDATVSSCLGATQAVEELIMERNARSEQIFPHFVFRANLS